MSKKDYTEYIEILISETRTTTVLYLKQFQIEVYIENNKLTQLFRPTFILFPLHLTKYLLVTITYLKQNYQSLLYFGHAFELGNPALLKLAQLLRLN